MLRGPHFVQLNGGEFSSKRGKAVVNEKVEAQGGVGLVKSCLLFDGFNYVDGIPKDHIEGKRTNAQDEDDEEGIRQERVVEGLVRKESVVVSQVSQHPHESLDQRVGRAAEGLLVRQEQLETQGKGHDEEENVDHHLKVCQEELFVEGHEDWHHRNFVEGSDEAEPGDEHANHSELPVNILKRSKI